MKKTMMMIGLTLIVASPAWAQYPAPQFNPNMVPGPASTPYMQTQPVPMPQVVPNPYAPQPMTVCTPVGGYGRYDCHQ